MARRRPRTGRPGAPSAEAEARVPPAMVVPDDPEAARRVLVLGCGALVNEMQAIVRHNDLAHVDVECLPAKLHNRPGLIADAARERIARLAAEGRAYGRILLGYADCGTAGALDELCAEYAAVADAPLMTRIDGVHCYEFYATAAAFEKIHEAEAATFYLTDYLARYFDVLIWRGLGIADHPELAEMYFGNYRRIVLLVQTTDPAERERVERCAREGAERLGLPLEIVETGYGDLETALTAPELGASVPLAVPSPRRQVPVPA